MDNRLRNFGFLLKELSRRYVQRFEVRAREISLNLAQCKVLVRLEKNEGVSQARLAELTEVDAMTMVRILDRMEADGLLERRPDPADRRARCLYLTAKAKPLLDEIWRLSDATRAEVFAGIGKSERDVCISVLERIHDNLIRLEGKGSPDESGPKAKPSAAGRLASIDHD
ncbi:MAG: MarR family winged helix-turn-helix transcriptional regulator [Steroidobacteraceae bacterium]